MGKNKNKSVEKKTHENKITNSKIVSEKNHIEKSDDLDWIDDLDSSTKSTNISNNKKNKKDKKNKDINNIKSNTILKNNLNTDLDIQIQKIDSDSDTESDNLVKNKSYKDNLIKITSQNSNKNNNFSNSSNRFGFINSDSDSDSESESDCKSESEKEVNNETYEEINKNSENKLMFEVEEMEQVEQVEEIEQVEQNNSKVLKEDNIFTQISIKENEDIEFEEKPKEKMNMKKREELKKAKKSQYNFELNTNSNNKTSEQKNVASSTNSIVTLYSENTDVTIGGKVLINSSDITINAGTKYFVLGQNGIGKTTLLKQIYSKLQSQLDILMLDQDIKIESSEQKVSEFILGADNVLYSAKKQLDKLEEKEELDEIEMDEYNKLSELVYQKEWDKYEAESKRIISGLGFTNPEQLTNILSGGKRMILALGKALLRKPDILILDEPTNHLDLDVVIWLTNYLESYKKTLIVITHQIGLVNSVADIIWYIGNPELVGNKLYTIRGKYDKLIKFLEQTENETTKNYLKFTKRVEELRKKSTPKKDVDEFIKKEGIPRPPKPYTVNITFDNVIELSTRNIIEFKDVSFGYQTESQLIYSGLDISLGMGSRMVLVGPNGCGKTTFFKLANKSIKPTSGYVGSDDRLRVGYYNQQIIDSLPLELNSIEYLKELNPKLDTNQCRTILGKLGIKKQDNLDLPTNKISDLSGGQKARVSFASVQMLNPHLILLDEPTNHLDLESIEGLIKGINDFNGGIVVITHDIYLIESITNADIYQVKSSNIIKFPGDFEEYCDYVYSHSNQN